MSLLVPGITGLQVQTVSGLLTSTVLSTRSALVSGGTPSWMPLNRRIGFLGDSITNASKVTNAVYAFPRQSLEFAGTLQNPVSLHIVSGVPGNTTAQMLARCVSDIPPSSIDILVIMGGTNDSSDLNAVTASQYGQNLTNIVALYPGKQIVIITPPPQAAPAVTAGSRQRIIDYRDWILANATGISSRVTVADSYPLLDDGTNTLLASCDSGDGIHPNNLGHGRIASRSGPAILVSQPARTSMVTALAAVNLISNGLMAGTLGPGDPSGWVTGVPAAQTSGTAAVRSIVEAPIDTAGQAYRLDITAAVNSRVRIRANLAQTFQTGDKILFIGRVKVNDITGDWEVNSAALTCSAVFRASNASSGADFSTSPVSCASLEREMAISYTVASGVTSIGLQAVLVIPSGSQQQGDFCEMAAFNLTALGLESDILV